MDVLENPAAHTSVSDSADTLTSSLWAKVPVVTLTLFTTDHMDPVPAAPAADGAAMTAAAMAARAAGRRGGLML
ncbi:hypothetical protein GCM10020218_025890 [Dactylosporangium vinaceum]